MKNILSIIPLTIAAMLPSCTADRKADIAWTQTYASIEASIQAPEFPDSIFNIRDYGTMSDDSTHLYTELINSTIAACSRAGGGHVVIPEGTWFTGPLTLLDNVDLHLEEGATLLFTDDLTLYPLVLTAWEGTDCYNYQPMIYAHRARNIAITGKGTIDGGACNDNWWRMEGKESRGWHEGVVSQRIGRPRIMAWNLEETPLEQRVLGDGYGMRVQLVNMVDCRDILIEGVTLLRSPFWVIHPLKCDNITVRGVTVINDGPNGDGCDPESCSNVLIEDCYFDTGDDCIAIKSGRNFDGRRRAMPSQNIIVRRCHMKNGHGGVVIGSEISGGFRNLFVHDCIMDSPELERVIRIKTNACRGGVIGGVYVRDVKVGRCREAVLKINLDYDPSEPGARDYPPVVEDVTLERVTCSESEYGVMIIGLENVCNVRDISLIDCEWSGVASGGNSITGLVSGLTFTDVTINGKAVE